MNITKELKQHKMKRKILRPKFYNNILKESINKKLFEYFGYNKYNEKERD